MPEHIKTRLVLIVHGVQCLARDNGEAGEEVDRDGKGTQKNKKNTSKKRLQSDKKAQKKLCQQTHTPGK